MIKFDVNDFLTCDLILGGGWKTSLCSTVLALQTIGKSLRERLVGIPQTYSRQQQTRLITTICIWTREWVYPAG